MTNITRAIPCLFLSVVCSAQPMTQSERDQAMSYLHATRKMFLDSIAGLSPAQLSFKAGPDRWSIADCAEHITVSEETILGVVERTAKMPAVKRDPAAYRKLDAELPKMLVDRSQKVQAPEQLKPTHRWKEFDAMIEEYKQRREKTIGWVEKYDGDVRSHVLPHPIFGDVDTYEWILLLAGHSERHTLQILEVKADPNFPKK